MTSLYSFGTPFGSVKVAPEASEDFQGLIEELQRAGAPLKNIGSYNYRNIAGTNTLSEHGKGKAIDVGNQQARDVVDPAFRAWVEENPQRYSQILQKYNMRGGETFKNPDLGHIEWRGEGAGDPLREAAPIGGAMPENSNYDTEDRTAAGIGLVPKGEDVAMAEEPRGILDKLGMQNQQPQGLLGALGDPETMSYIAMVLKGINPYSQIDPNSMLSNAHTLAMRKQALQAQEAERAIDNARADKAFGLQQERFNYDKSDRERRIALEETQRKREADIFKQLGPQTVEEPPTEVAAPPDPNAPAVPGMDQEFDPFKGTAAATSPAATAAKTRLPSVDEKIAIIDKELGAGGLDDKAEARLLRIKENLLKPNKDQTLTQAQKELKDINAAREARGERKLDLDEWILQGKTAGAMRIGETTEDKLSAERASKNMERAGAASSEIQRLNILENRLEQMQTGALAGTKMTMGAWANALGIPDDFLKKWGMDAKTTATAQQVQALVNRQLVDQIGQGKFPANNFSDADRNFLSDSLPKISNLPEANKDIIEISRRIERRNIDKGKAYLAWKRDPQNKGRSPDEFELNWADYTDKNDIFADMGKKYTSSAPAGGGQPAAKRYIYQDGKLVPQ